MEELYKNKDPTSTTTTATTTSGQVQKSANKKKSKNKKTHTVNAMNEELLKTTTTTTRKIDQCTNNDDDKNQKIRTECKHINGIVEQVENLHIKDNGYCLANGSKLNGHHQYDGAKHVSESTAATTTTTITPAKQLVNEKSKKSKSKSKNKEHCQLKNVENCMKNGDPLTAINTGKPTVLSTAKETIVTEQQQQQQQQEVVRDIIATAVAAADIEEVKATEDETLVTNPALEQPKIHIEYTEYQSELQMHDIMRLIQAELSEPYSIYTYRYFIYNWPKLCFLAAHGSEYVGAIVCKLDMHVGVKRGYIAMLAVRKEYRNLRIGTTLVQKAIEAMVADNADEVVLETEMRNFPALHLYENLGFVRDKRLFRYYLNGVDALRLKLWFR